MFLRKLLRVEQFLTIFINRNLLLGLLLHVRSCSFPFPTRLDLRRRLLFCCSKGIWIEELLTIFVKWQRLIIEIFLLQIPLHFLVLVEGVIESLPLFPALKLKSLGSFPLSSPSSSYLWMVLLEELHLLVLVKGWRKRVRPWSWVPADWRVVSKIASRPDTNPTPDLIVSVSLHHG